MARVKLSEVVRSTKRIVAGAATFPASTGTVLLTGLFCCASAQDQTVPVTVVFQPISASKVSAEHAARCRSEFPGLGRTATEDLPLRPSSLALPAVQYLGIPFVLGLGVQVVMATKAGQDLLKVYAEHIIKALWHVSKNLGLQIPCYIQAFVCGSLVEPRTSVSCVSLLQIQGRSLTSAFMGVSPSSFHTPTSARR